MRQLPRRVFQFLLPSFLHPSSNNSEPRKNNVAALDGLRGVACLIVFNAHLTHSLTLSWVSGLGVNGGYNLPRFPFLRLPYLGWSMVNVFFVISGYVLSYKPFRQWDCERDPRATYGTIAVSVLKRGPRLYLPTFIALFIIAVSSYLGAFDVARRNWLMEKALLDAKKPTLWKFHESEPPIFNTLSAQLIDAWSKAVAMFQIINWRTNIHSGTYDTHTWTIPVEFRTSMLLFMFLAVVLNMKPNSRVICFCVVMLLAAFSELFDVVCFFGGALLAMWDVEHLQASLPSTKETAKVTAAVSWKTGMLLFVGGLFLLSASTQTIAPDPFYGGIAALFPAQVRDKGAYPRAIGSIMTTWAVVHWPPAKALFTNKFCGYLGKISYALYLVHGSVIRAILHVLIPITYKWTGDGTFTGQTWVGTTVAWCVGTAACVPVSIWISDMFYRAVDIPTVRLCKWIETEAYKWRPKIRAVATGVAEMI